MQAITTICEIGAGLKYCTCGLLLFGRSAYIICEEHPDLYDCLPGCVKHVCWVCCRAACLKLHEHIPEVIAWGCCRTRLPHEVQGSRQFFANLLKSNRVPANVLMYATEEVRNDRSLFLEVLRYGRRADASPNIIQVAVLEYASPNILQDREFIKHATSICISSVLYASPQLQSDVELMLDIARHDPFGFRLFLMFLPAESWKRLPALMSTDFWLQFLAPFSDGWHWLIYAPDHIRGNFTIMATAIGVCWKAIHFAKPATHEDEFALIVAAVKVDWHAAEGYLLTDRSVEEKTQLADANPYIIQHPAMVGVRPAILAALKRNGLALQYVSAAQRGDMEIVATAVMQNIAALQYVSLSFQWDRSLWKLGVSTIGMLTVESASSDVSVQVVGNLPPASHELPRWVSHQDFDSQALQTLAQHVFKLWESADRDIMNRLVKKIDSQHSRLFSLEDYHYGERGGSRYFKPCGWVRLAVRSEPHILRHWCVAYHGTSVSTALKILVEGFKPPSTVTDQSHGQCYSSSGRTIYVTPAIEHAAHPVYACLSEIDPNNWLQAVIQVRVRPGSFVSHPLTLSNHHWPRHLRIDPNFDNPNGLEWLLEDPRDIAVTGVMLRQLGSNADPAVFGDTAARVAPCMPGPEHEWTRLRAHEFEDRGFSHM